MALRNRATNSSYFEEVPVEAIALAEAVGVEMDALRGAHGGDRRDYFERLLY